MSVLSPLEFARYNRQIILPGFGLEAQQKLKDSSVLVIGAGGLGSPLILYLAAAGVGTLGIIDHDVVDESNLQRQVLYSTDHIGQPKVDIAKEKINTLNPNVRVDVYHEKFNDSNAGNLIDKYDVIADATDNFPTRYLINDTCVALNKPYVYGSIYQYEGQVTVFNYAGGPNYRDLYPSPPPPSMIPNCAEGGVIGILPGIIGSIQSMEVIKLLTGIGKTLSGRLFMFDALRLESREITFGRANAGRTDAGRTDAGRAEGVPGPTSTGRTDITDISIAEFQQLKASGEDFQLIDVREPYEYDIVNIDAELMPLASIESCIDRIDRNKKVILHCKSGARSAKAIQLLQDKYSYTNLLNLKGGILAYIEEVDPSLRKY